MTLLVPFQLTPLTLDQFGEVLDFWRRAEPLSPIRPDLLRERLFSNPAADGELLLAARDGAGQLAGLAAGVAMAEHSQYAGVRWLGVDPAVAGQGVEKLLLEELGRRLAARGVAKARLMGTPPYYLRPGIDTRQTALLATLLDLGWRREAITFNMNVDLAVWTRPAEHELWGPDVNGYTVRRAQPGEREAFAAYMNEHWTANWRDEALQAFAHEPLTLFLALHERRIVGFAACEVSQCTGAFGPTGVTPEHRGHGLGRRLLGACLAELQDAGQTVCEIGWTDQVQFYYRSCGATLGATYWLLTRSLTDPA